MFSEIISIFMIGLLFIASPYTQAQESGDIHMKIRITAGGEIAIATLNSSQAAQDFAILLPLTLTLGDYGVNEKVSDLPKKLSIAGAPSGYTPSKGDFSYYAPWGNIAIFRHDFRYSDGLIKLGEIDGGFEAINKSGSIEVVIDTF
ncbi:cyclophilin-like fold protein [Orbus sturtevantii]|uniref:cyclophilin-like fold protein n=1 Tax=Orbus sturtevantii TaxID=3074109 RepID=UPI00370DC5EC